MRRVLVGWGIIAIAAWIILANFGWRPLAVIGGVALVVVVGILIIGGLYGRRIENEGRLMRSDESWVKVGVNAMASNGEEITWISVGSDKDEAVKKAVKSMNGALGQAHVVEITAVRVLSSSVGSSQEAALENHATVVVESLDGLRQHYGEDHDWTNPTQWQGVMDWNAFCCNTCGLISQQPMLESEIGVVPFIVLRPSPVGMRLDVQAPGQKKTIVETIKGGWKFPDGCDSLDLEGTITGDVVVPMGKTADVTGVVGGLIVEGGSAYVDDGEVLNDIVFVDGELGLYGAVVRGVLRTDLVSGIDDFSEDEHGHDWRPNGPDDPPGIFINFETEIAGGIVPIT